jgi:hypothetical protein
MCVKLYNSRYLNIIYEIVLECCVCVKICRNFCFKISAGTLCAQDVDNLTKWTPQAVSTVSKNLTPQGYKDAYNLALRYKSRFPTLLNQPYSPDKYEVSSLKTKKFSVM